MSQREAAEALGVSHTTVQNDPAINLPESGNKLATDRAQRVKQNQEARRRGACGLAVRRPQDAGHALVADLVARCTYVLSV
jgi:hypothetical protein